MNECTQFEDSGTGSTPVAVLHTVCQLLLWPAAALS